MDRINALTIRRLHYEIEKAEADLEEVEEQIKKAKTEQPKTKKPKSFWAFLTMDSEDEE